MRTLWAAVAAVISAIALQTSEASADAVADFYRGKSISILIPSAPGGGYDTYGRLVGRYFAEHIPGRPNIVPQNMPGAGGIAEVNYLYNVAPKDGTTIGIIEHGTTFKPIFDPREVRYKISGFRWLGSVTPITVIGVIRKDAPVTTVADLFDREVVIGGSGGTTVYLPLALNSILGTKIKLVKGYKNTNDIMLAMARREVEGVVGIGLDSLEGSKAVGDVDYRILFQMGVTRGPALPDVPLIQDYAKSADDRAVLETIFASFSIGRSFVTPLIPEDRFAALKAAFAETIADPKFVAQAKKAHADVGFVSAEEIQKIIERVYSQPEPVLKRAGAAMLGAE